MVKQSKINVYSLRENKIFQFSSDCNIPNKAEQACTKYSITNCSWMQRKVKASVYNNPV